MRLSLWRASHKVQIGLRHHLQILALRVRTILNFRSLIRKVRLNIHIVSGNLTTCAKYLTLLRLDSDIGRSFTSMLSAQIRLPSV